MANINSQAIREVGEDAEKEDLFCRVQTDVATLEKQYGGFSKN